MIRKLYIKARLFLYAKSGFLNRVTLIAMLTILFYLFFNTFLFKTVILNKANHDQINHKYNSAIVFYNIAYTYYKLNHFSQGNKDIYFELPYKISMCYLLENDKKDSAQIMLNGITDIQKQYGTFSKETAYFIKKYLIDYYLLNKNSNLAQLEFKNLITIYKTIGFDDNIVSDLLRLNGDINYQQENYSVAVNLYEQAYNKIIVQKDMDYEAFEKIVDRIGSYETQNDDVDGAIETYKKALSILSVAPDKYSDLNAKILIKLGDLYIADDLSAKDALNCYEQAVNIIKTLPKTNSLKQDIGTYLTTLKNLYIKTNQYTKANEIDLEITRQRRFSFY